MSGRQSTTTTPDRVRGTLAFVLAATVLAVLAIDATGLIRDIAATVRSPLELDYGEGIVWQQAALIPGPRMYPMGQDLPFIVFHYPPVFHLVTRAFLAFEPTMLAAGRLVSISSMLVIALTVAGLILLAGKQPGRRVDASTLWSAVVGGLLVLCLHAVRSWGLLMRVDTLAVALSLLGVLAGAWANGRVWALTVALLLCVAAVFTKQTQLAAGIAVFAVAMLRDVRSALLAAVIAGGIGLGVVGWLQWQTGGGFLHNIIGYNINRFAFKQAIWGVLWPERTSIPVVLLAGLSATAILLGPVWRTTGTAWRALPRTWMTTIRHGDRSATIRLMLLVYLGVASAMLFTVFKVGGNYNYLIDWLCVGGTLLGIAAGDITRRGFRSSPGLGALAALVFAVVFLPFRNIPDQWEARLLASHDALLRRVASADKPVASENMTVLMQAGKPVIFEPAIVTELAFVGRWDERPLVDMIRAGGFAFMVISDDAPGGTQRRTPAVDEAMRASYPRLESIAPMIWIRLPAGG